MNNISEKKFKSFLSNFATGVAVITYVHNGSRHGITISSLASLSLSPQLISFSIDKNSNRYKDLLECKSYTVNILSESQENISKAFVTNDYKENPDIYFEETENPKSLSIKDSVCYIECEKETIYDGGDHSIFISKVIEGEVLSSENPLIYFRSKYNKIS